MSASPVRETLYRQPHRKTRTGCDQCKQRHVKCDEKAPTCSTCTRLGMTCTYYKRQQTQKAKTTAKAAAKPKARPPIQPVASLTPDSTQLTVSPSWSTTDLELLHHFTTCSCIWYPPQGTRRKLWTHDYPILSFSKPYLLHQILAVAALHRYVEDDSRTDLASLAMQHRARALEGVQDVISDMDAESSIPIFGFAGLTAAYAFGELAIHLKDDGDRHDTLSQLIACFQLNRGVATIVRMRSQDIKDSWARELITLSAEDDLVRLRAVGLKLAHADALHELIKTHIGDLEDRDACQQAAVRCLEYIQVLLCQQDEDHPVYFLIMSWTCEVDARYLTLVESRNPVALVVLAQYAALMTMRPRLWWLAKWSELLLEQIGGILGAEWDEWLQWPRMMLDKRRQTRP